MSKIFIFTILFLMIFGLLLPVGKVEAFSLVDGISKCVSTGNCTVCDMLQVLYNVAKFIFISMSGIALIMILWAGIGLIMNWGMAEGIAANKKIILHTLLAVAIILLAWTLVNALIFFLAGADNKGNLNVYKNPDFKESLWTGSWWVGPKCK
ncbi:MAG: hypothetical protein ABIJ91_02830 [Candidatus Kuenenbacteria bacterium]